MATPVTADTLRAVAPRFTGAPARAQADIIGAIADDFSAVLAEYEINTDLRVAHFLAQIVHESAGLRTTVEFASGAAYEGRVNLGNTVPGDGKKFRGRGLIQLTGRANYRKYGKLLGLDLEGQPHMAAEPLTSLKIACVYWQDRKINPLCDADNLEGVTRKVNGGLNGLEDRRRYLVKAKQALGTDARGQALAQASAGPVVEADDSAPSPHAAREPEAEAAHGTDARGQAPAEAKPGVFSSMSFAKVNELADQGSRIAGWIRSIKRWFWGGTVTVGTGASLVNTEKGSAHAFTQIVADHPFLFVAVVLGIAGLVIYFVAKMLERHLVTAALDGRYKPRGG